MSKISRRSLVAGTAAGAALAILAVAAVLGDDPRSKLCPIDENKVLAAFEIPHARDYKLYVPMMLRSPELESGAPAMVVLFDGPARLTVMGSAPGGTGDQVQAQPATTREFDGVVCVVVGDQANVYTDVDIRSWRRP